MAIWQQQMQMMESFHNDMILMVQMFMAMHREHVISVSDELDRISQLTQEMTDLRARLAGIPEPETPNPPTSKSSPPSAVAKPESSSSTKANASGIVDRSAREPAGVLAGRASPVPPSGTIIPVAPSDRSLAGPVAGKSKQAINVDFHSHLTRRVAELQRERQSYWQKILSVITG